MSPDDGVSSFAIMRATVDFPEPDSPTMAIVLPGSSVNDTSFTARSRDRFQPLRTTKSLVRFRISKRAHQATPPVLSAVSSPDRTNPPRSPVRLGNDPSSRRVSCAGAR